MRHTTLEALERSSSATLLELTSATLRRLDRLIGVNEVL